MPKKTPEEVVSLMMESEKAVPLGEYSAWNSGNGGVVVPFPQPYARNAGLEGGGDVEIYLDTETGGIYIRPLEG